MGCLRVSAITVLDAIVSSSSFACLQDSSKSGLYSLRPHPALLPRLQVQTQMEFACAPQGCIIRPSVFSPPAAFDPPFRVGYTQKFLSTCDGACVRRSLHACNH